MQRRPFIALAVATWFATAATPLEAASVAPRTDAQQVRPTPLEAASVAPRTDTQNVRALPARVDLRADRIGLFIYGDGTTVLDATGHAVTQAGARTIAAERIRYDLKTNTLVASGAVAVSDGTHQLAAAAYALDLRTGEARLIELDPLPRTLALRDDDPASAVEAAAPPVTFAVLDLGESKPFLRTRHAVITPSVNVRLTPAEVPTGPGPYLPTPSYLYTFAPTNFSQSALPAASFDQPYPLFGTANALAAGHFRYDRQTGATIGFDEHLVEGDRAYAVASILPLRGKEINLNAFEQLRPGLTQSLNATRYYGIVNANFLQYQFQWTSPSSRATLSSALFGASNTTTLTLSSLEHAIPRFLTYRAQLSYGYDHFPGLLPFANAFRIGADAYVASPKVTLPLGIDASAKYEYAITTYDFPHEVTVGTASLTFSRRVNRSLAFLGTASLQQSANRYRVDAARFLGLPNPNQPYYAPDGTPYPGFFAYAGINTYRTYSLQTTWQPAGRENSLQLYLTHTHDFPQFHGYGRAPNYATFAITERLGTTLRLSLARSYAFGWSGQYLVPGYSLSISP